MKKLALVASWLLVSFIVLCQTQPLLLATNLPKSKTTISKRTSVLSTLAPNVQALPTEEEVNEKMLSASLYPNPTTGNLTVDFGSNIDNAKITLYDANGRLVNNEEVVNKASYTIDLSTYAKGLYTVVINSKNGQSVHKVSKQ